jgi:hypothetical protein
MSGGREPVGWAPTERPSDPLDDATIAVQLPWVERTANEIVQGVRIKLAEYTDDEQCAIEDAVARLLDHRRSAA